MTTIDPAWTDQLLRLLARLESVDLAHPLTQGMPRWPTHTTYRHDILEDFPDTAARHFELCLGEHTGTHLDAASHILPGAPDISSHPAAGILAAAAVIHLPAQATTRVSAETLLAWEREHGTITAGTCVLFAFGWDAHWTKPGYMRSWPALAPDAGELLAERAPALVAVDTISVDAPEAETLPVHRTLLAASVVIGENFANLQQLPDQCLLAALPLPIQGGTGSPVRPIAYVPHAHPEEAA